MRHAASPTAPLRRAIRQIQRQRNPKRRRYDPALRRRVTAHVLAERSRGRSVRWIAADLGLSYQTLLTWLQGQSRGFRAVVATKAAPPPPAPCSELRLILAQGHRVEGLSADDLVAVLRALS